MHKLTTKATTATLVISETTTPLSQSRAGHKDNLSSRSCLPPDSTYMTTSKPYGPPGELEGTQVAVRFKGTVRPQRTLLLL